jgi:hypothetical protein
MQDTRPAFRQKQVVVSATPSICQLQVVNESGHHISIRNQPSNRHQNQDQDPNYAPQHHVQERHSATEHFLIMARYLAQLQDDSPEKHLGHRFRIHTRTFKRLAL